MKLYLHILILVIITLCQSCANNYSFRDSDYNSINDVIVISSQHRYIFTPEEHWAGISDNNGIVKNIPQGNILIFKSGYYPIFLQHHYPYTIPYESIDSSKPKQYILHKLKNISNEAEYISSGESKQSFFWQNVEHSLGIDISISACSPIDLIYLPYNPWKSSVKFSSSNPNISFSRAKSFYWSKQDEIKIRTKAIVLKRGETVLVINKNNKPIKKIRINGFGSYSEAPDQVQQLQIEFLVSNLPKRDLILIPTISKEDILKSSYFLKRFYEEKKSYIGSVEFNEIKKLSEEFQKSYEKYLKF